ncbi:MAG TPA: hypothetical protein VJQ25_06330 [Nitrospira sp.]|nr:hypothetical protein [Nitrospira sp.]
MLISTRKNALRIAMPNDIVILLLDVPPDISIDRYAEIEEGCKRQAVKDLDTLALCYQT